LEFRVYFCVFIPLDFHRFTIKLLGQFHTLQSLYIIIVTSGGITKAINNLFKEIFLVFSVISGENFSVFLKLNIKLIK
jgi:hypothetical protein